MRRKHVDSRPLIGIIGISLLSAGVSTSAHSQDLSRGQTVYVSVYSSIWYGAAYSGDKPATMALSGMLSIRNVDPDHDFKLRSIRYYDTDGKLMREENPQLSLGPLASKSMFIPHSDTGGIGAKFIVVWEADVPINTPIIEYLNIYKTGTSLNTFVSHGRPIQTKPSP